MTNVKSETLKGVKWSAVEKITFQGLQFLIGLILARLLSPEDFGVIGMITIFIALSQSIIDSGFANALIRKKDRTQEDYSTVFYFNIIVGIICYCILFFSAPWIADFFNTPILKPVTRVVAVNLFISSLTIVQVAQFQINIDFKSLAKVTAVGALSGGFFGIILAYLGFGVWALVGQTVGGGLVRMVLIFCVSKWHPNRVFSKKSFRELFGYGSKIMLAGIIGTVYNHLTTLVIGKFYTSKDLGFYTRGSHFASLPSTLITDVLGRVTFPILAKLQDDTERLVSVYRKYIRSTSFVVFFCFIILASIGHPLILILLSEKWEPAVIYLQILCIAYLPDHISRINLNLLQVKGRSDLFLRLEIIKKTISCIILFSSIPFGVMAICLSKILYSVIALTINTYYTGKLFKMGIWMQAKDFLPYLIKTLIACAPGFIISLLDFSPYLQLLFGVMCGITLYYLMNLHDSNFYEMKEIVLNVIKNRKIKNNL